MWEANQSSHREEPWGVERRPSFDPLKPSAYLAAPSIDAPQDPQM